MLTGLDFPEELLYGETALWVRDDGGGSVRVGLNVYALPGWPQEIVHIQLPRGGTRVERGRAFGHVDLAGATFDLVSPVSGAVLLANLDLRQDPAVLRADPYGKGFLIDVENVAKEELESLMEREDALAFYSRFEPEGNFRASMRIEPGRPWASSFSARFGDLFFARGRLVPPLANEIFVPDWEVGDKWTIETKTAAGGAVRRFRYLVEGEGRVGGEEVTRLFVKEMELTRERERVDSPAPGTIARRLYVRQEDFTLAAWDALPGENPALALRTWNERGKESWLRCGNEDGFILDHAKLPLGLEDETREIAAGVQRAALDAGADDMYAALLPPLTSYVKFRGGLTRLEVELRADLPRLEGGTSRLFSMQTWDRGKPWWSEAVRTLEGKETVKAKLVEG